MYLLSIMHRNLKSFPEGPRYLLCTTYIYVLKKINATLNYCAGNLKRKSLCNTYPMKALVKSSKFCSLNFIAGPFVKILSRQTFAPYGMRGNFVVLVRCFLGCVL